MADRRTPMRRVLSRGLGLAMNAGLLSYRPILPSEAITWDRDYAAGQLEYYRRLSETARYGVLIGYLTALGGPSRVLDVGCGVGILRERLTAVVLKEYVGVDVSAVAVEAARARLTDPLTTFVCTPARRAGSAPSTSPSATRCSTSSKSQPACWTRSPMSCNPTATCWCR